MAWHAISDAERPDTTCAEWLAIGWTFDVTNFQWIDSEAACAAWLARQPASRVIGLDTEFMRTNTLRARLALVQINLDGHIALADAPVLGTHPALAARLREADSICVMHSASEDLEALAGIVAQGPANLFDTQIAAAMTGLGPGLSYQKLVAELLDIDIPKGETRSDWLQRPLSDSQREYAAQDVAHLPRIHAVLSERLAAFGREHWLAEDCARLVEKVCHAQPDMQPQRAFPRAADWPRTAQALLRRVLLWRDATARALDKPRPWILDDAHALDLAVNPPRDGTELFERCKGLRALRGPQRQDLLNVLQAPLSEDELDIVPIPPPLNSAQKRTVASLRDAVATIAQSLNIPDSVLCPRRHLETLVREAAWPVALQGWREPILFDALMAKARAAP